MQATEPTVGKLKGPLIFPEGVRAENEADKK